MAARKIVESVVRERWVDVCCDCGKDFQVQTPREAGGSCSPLDARTQCGACFTKEKEAQTRKRHEHLLGATVVDLKIDWTDVERVVLHTTDGRAFEVFAESDYDGRADLRITEVSNRG